MSLVMAARRLILARAALGLSMVLVGGILGLQPDSANAGPTSPANDDFANATIVGEPLPFSDVVDTTAASRELSEPFEPCFGSDLLETVWYSFTPSTDVVVTAVTFGSDFSAAVVPYVGDSLATLVPAPVSFQGCSLGEVIFPASAGVTYSIQVGGPGFPAGGNLSFQMTVKPPPIKGNDDFADSVVIPEPLPFTNTQDVRGATLQAGEPQSCSPISFSQSVWYSFTPSIDSVLTPSTSGSDFFASVAAYRGTSLDTLFSVGCENFASNSFTATAGVTYYFQVGSRFRNPGNLVFNLSSTPCPASGCVKMVMNVTGGVCDDPLKPSKCDVPLGEEFILSVEALAAPATGYSGMQTYIDFGSDLIYDFNAVSAADEVVWPACSGAVALKGQPVAKLNDLGTVVLDPITLNPLANSSHEVVAHACLSGLIPPLPTSFYTGDLVELSLTCSSATTTTEVILRPRGDPLTVTSGSAFAFMNPTTFSISLTIAKTSDLTINCVQPPPPVGGISLGDELASLPLDSPDDSSGSYGAVTLSIAIAAGVALLAGIGWFATRRRLR